MRGHITQRRAGVWRIVVSAGFGPDGKRRQITRTVRGTKRDAERERTTMLRELDQGRLIDGRQSLRRFLEDEWLPATARLSKRGRPLAPTTRAKYAGAVGHISRIIGGVRLQDLRAAHVEALRDRLTAEGNLAPQTIADILRVLSQALTRAETRDLARNVAAPALVNRPVGEKPKFTVIDRALAGRILAAAEGTEWDAPSHLALGLGLRREEVLGLRWEDVDEDEVRVRQTLTWADGSLHVGGPKSAAGRRDLPLPGFVARSLARHRKAQADRLWPLGVRSDLVVATPIGEPWMPASFSTGWRRWSRRQGFEGITFHALRHGAASLLLAAEVPDKVALEIMGHAGTEMLRHYQEVADELKQDAAARMDRLLGGDRG